MFANGYLPITLGENNFEIQHDGHILQKNNKRFNKPDKEIKTLPLTEPNIDDIVSNIKRGVKYVPSYIPDEFKEHYQTKTEVLEDKTRYCLVTHNKNVTDGVTGVAEVSILESVGYFKQVREQLKNLEYHRFHDDYRFINKLSRLKTQPSYLKCIKHNGNICVYSTFNQTAFIYYNSISPEVVESYLNHHTIVWGCYTEFFIPLGTILYPENVTKKPLTYIRLKQRNLFMPIPKTKTISPADVLSLAIGKRYKIDRTAYNSVQYFIFCCLNFDKILTYYEKDGILIFTCDIDKNCVVMADDNSTETIREAQNICNSMGGKMIVRPEITKEQALDPKLNLNCMFFHDKTMLDLSGSEKRELRRIYNKIEREDTLEIKVTDNPNEIRELITGVICPMRNQWAKEKVKRENELKLPIYYDLFITAYYRNLQPDVLRNIPVTVIIIYDKGEPQALVVSEQVCKTFVYNTEAVSVSKPSVKQTRAILATEEFRYWYEKLKDDELIICSGVTKLQGLKQMKINHYPCSILKIVG